MSDRHQESTLMQKREGLKAQTSPHVAPSKRRQVVVLTSEEVGLQISYTVRTMPQAADQLPPETAAMLHSLCHAPGVDSVGTGATHKSQPSGRLLFLFFFKTQAMFFIFSYN